MRHKKSEGEYLAFLCVKYEVDPDDLFYALLSSGEKGEADCGNLFVECRGKKNEKLIFLITSNSKVVAQFPISENFLKLSGNPIRIHMETEAIKKQMLKRLRPDSPHLIRNLRVGMNHINLKVKVLKITKPKFVITRYGNHASFVKAVISDETGQINLCLWNDQIGLVTVEDRVHIENARVSAFKGERLLTLGRKGTLNNVKLLNNDS